jgi:hypothetical protein
MEDVGIFYGHLDNFMAIWTIFRPFGTFYGHLVYFPPFWYIFSCFGMLYQEKSGSPGLETHQNSGDGLLPLQLLDESSVLFDPPMQLPEDQFN